MIEGVEGFPHTRLLLRGWWPRVHPCGLSMALTCKAGVSSEVQNPAGCIPESGHPVLHMHNQ
eukprot:1136523-Pelagomonas_calceolata.AAC.2